MRAEVEKVDIYGWKNPNFLAMQVNFQKCEYPKDQLDYLGLMVNQNGIKPYKNNVQYRLGIKTTNTNKQFSHFIRLINLY